MSETVGEQTDKVTFVMLFSLVGWWGAFWRKGRYANVMQLQDSWWKLYSCDVKGKQHYNTEYFTLIGQLHHPPHLQALSDMRKYKSANVFVLKPVIMPVCMCCSSCDKQFCQIDLSQLMNLFKNKCLCLYIVCVACIYKYTNIPINI